MFFIFDMQDEWTWSISNNYIIKSEKLLRERNFSRLHHYAMV